MTKRVVLIDSNVLSFMEHEINMPDTFVLASIRLNLRSLTGKIEHRECINSIDIAPDIIQDNKLSKAVSGPVFTEIISGKFFVT